jgi:hypothetical protein
MFYAVYMYQRWTGRGGEGGSFRCGSYIEESYLFQKYKKKAEFIAWKQAKIYGPVN